MMTSLACANRLKDYTQVTMALITPGSEEVSEEQLAETTAILENRLVDIGIELAEVKAAEPNQVVVRLPLDADVQATETLLTNTGQLSLRSQKPDTQAELDSSIEDLQRLLVELNTYLKTDDLSQAEALQPRIDKARAAIVDLFEPSELTGAQVAQATARQATGDVWEVDIQFDEQGTERFATQTQELAGTDRSIGIFLDEVLLSAPVVAADFAEAGITGGTAVISGNLTETAAKSLEILLNSGALPITLETVEITSTADVSVSQ